MKFRGIVGMENCAVHGSFAGAGLVGDIDVAVSIAAEALRDRDVTRYELALEAALEHGLSVPIDVRVLDHAPLSFQYAALRGEPLFVRDAAALAAFRERTWSRYLDFAPLREEVLRDLAAQLAGNADARSAPR
jgi:hypothetical protein